MRSPVTAAPARPRSHITPGVASPLVPRSRGALCHGAFYRLPLSVKPGGGRRRGGEEAVAFLFYFSGLSTGGLWDRRHVHEAER